MAVTIRAFGRDGAEPVDVARFEAAVDAEALVEAGESFLLRGAFDDGRVVENASKVQKALVSYPLTDTSAPPVTLEIRYDGHRAPIEIKGGRAFVAEPRQGQAVTLVLRRLDTSAQRYGVVLFVNGQSTLFKERGEASQCRMWVLGPNSPSAVIKGYQVDTTKAEAFRVLSPIESKRSAIDYGSDVGTIALVVFQERQEGPAPLNLSHQAEELAAISRGVFPENHPENLAGLKFSLREGDPNRATRGLIKEGQTVGAPIRRVDFHPESTPSMAATITYYRP
jgi:hypothetical protein